MADPEMELHDSIDRLYEHGLEWRRRAEAAEAALLRLRQQVEGLGAKWKRDRESWPPFGDGGQCARKAIAKCEDDVRACLDTLRASK